MKELHDIINKYRLSGKTFSVHGLLEELDQKRVQFDREEVADAIQHYFPLHFHFTPREISYLLSELAFNYSPKSIADIACGIGSNLAVCDYASVRVGYEINQEIVDLARYFNPGLEIIAADSVYLDESKHFDAIISTLPFGGRYKVGPNHESLEITLINKAINLLSDNGAVLVVVPKTLLTSKDGSKLRHRIINEFCLDAIIEIPTDKSWTTIDSAILVFRKGKNLRLE
jgi:type I restriction-modification system DNA methylase subunit